MRLIVIKKVVAIKPQGLSLMPKDGTYKATVRVLLAGFSSGEFMYDSNLLPVLPDSVFISRYGKLEERMLIYVRSYCWSISH